MNAPRPDNWKNMEKKIKTLGLLRTKSFDAELDRVELDNGSFKERLIIKHPGGISVIPFIDDENILMVTQYRYALGTDTLEIPAGKLNKSESPEEATHRELKEETGYEATDITKITSFAAACGYSDEIIHVYKATGLKKTGARTDTDEISQVEIVETKKLKNMVQSGEIIDGSTILSLAVLDWL